MRFLLSCTFFWVMSGVLYAQTPVIDSIRSTIRPTDTPLEQVGKYSAMVQQFKKNYPDSQRVYSKLMMLAAQQTSSDSLIGLSMFNYGRSLYNFALVDSAKAYWEKALPFSERCNDVSTIASLNNNLGVLYQNMGLYELAIAATLKSQAIRIAQKDTSKIPFSYINLSSLYNKQGNYEKAIEESIKAIGIWETTANNQGLSAAYSNLGYNYFLLGRLDEAERSQKKAIELIGGDVRQRALAFNNLGHIYLAQKKYDQAEGLYKVVLEKADIAETIDFLGAYEGLGKLYNELGQYNKAIGYAEKGYELAKSKEMVMEQQKLADVLASAYRGLGNYRKALDYKEIGSELASKIYNENLLKKTADLEAGFRYHQKEDQLLKANEEKEAQRQLEAAWERRLRWAMLAIAVLMLLVAGLMMRYWRSSVKKNKELESKNEEITLQAEALELANARLQETNVFKKELAGMVVHDMKGPLNTIMGLVSSSDSVPSHRSIHGLTRRLMQMADTIIDVQRFEEAKLPIRAEDKLMSEMVTLANMHIAYLAGIKQIRVETQIPNGLTCHADPDLVVRVLANMLDNAIKYSPEGGRVDINASLEGGWVTLSVSDQGDGVPEGKEAEVFGRFNKVTPKPLGQSRAYGLGLSFCRMAVEAHGGKIGVRKSVLGGAMFWFTLPIGKPIDIPAPIVPLPKPVQEALSPYWGSVPMHHLSVWEALLEKHWPVGEPKDAKELFLELLFKQDAVHIAQALGLEPITSAKPRP